MQIGDLSSILQTTFAWLISEWEVIATGLGVTALLLWLRARTGSNHVLAARLWQLVLGKRDIKSPVLAAYLDERNDLMHFRNVTGIKRVGTQAAAERLVHWVRGHDVDIDLVGAAGLHFDVEKPGFHRPPPGPAAWGLLALATAVFLYGAITLGGAGAFLPPVIRVIASDTWYVVAPERAHRFRLGGDPTPRVTHERCTDQPAVVRSTGYPAHDVEVLCELMSTAAGHQARREAQIGQYILTGAGTLGLFVASVILFRALWRADKAQKLYRLITRRPVIHTPEPHRPPTRFASVRASIRMRLQPR